MPMQTTAPRQEVGDRLYVRRYRFFDQGLAADLAEVVLRPPDVLVDDRARLEVGGRHVELSLHGRAHTDHDLVVTVPDAGVAFAGDTIEEGNAPHFGDGFPVAWPETLGAFLAGRQERVVVELTRPVRRLTRPVRRLTRPVSPRAPGAPAGAPGPRCRRSRPRTRSRRPGGGCGLR